MEGNEFFRQICPICLENFNEDDAAITCILYNKGSETLNKISEERNDHIETVPGQRVHQNCRRDNTRTRNATKEPAGEKLIPSQCPPMRSAEPSYDFKRDCLYCGQPVSESIGIHDVPAYRVFSVTTIETEERRLFEVCKARGV